jgi:hypothetical protein
MASCLFTSRQNSMVCVVSLGSTGASLPAQYGRWDRTDVPWDGQRAAFVAGVRELLDARENEVQDYESDARPPVRH